MTNGSFTINSALRLDSENERIIFNASSNSTFYERAKPTTGVYSVRGDGSNLIELTDGLGTPYKLGINGISAIGDSILYNLNSPTEAANDTALLVSSTDGSGDTTLISSEFVTSYTNKSFDGSNRVYIAQATLSSDGDEVMFIKRSYVSNKYEESAYLVNLNSPDSSLELTIVPDVQDALAYSLANGLVQWLSDGESIAFASNEKIQSNDGYIRKNLIYVMNPTGTLVARYELPLVEPTKEFVYARYNENGQYIGEGMGAYNQYGEYVGKAREIIQLKKYL